MYKHNRYMHGTLPQGNNPCVCHIHNSSLEFSIWTEGIHLALPCVGGEL